MICPYCGNEARCVTGGIVYPHRPELRRKWFYLCRPCDARVGCHGRTTRPLGRLANAELRRAKMAAHDAFDRLWKNRRSRTEAYAWLAERLGIPKSECHIGMFDVEQCRQVVEACRG